MNEIGARMREPYLQCKRLKQFFLRKKDNEEREREGEKRKIKKCSVLSSFS